MPPQAPNAMAHARARRVYFRWWTVVVSLSAGARVLCMESPSVRAAYRQVSCYAALAWPVLAMDYRTVDTVAVLYDAPSLRGAKLFVIKRDTPVELVVNLEGWSKVRDAEGGLAWIEKKHLAERRTVIVTAARAEVRQKPEDGASLVFEADRKVSLDFLEVIPGGWVKVRHRDGQSGFVRANQVWGI